jgi:hypothetical protein
MRSQCDPIRSSSEIHSEMGPSELGCPSALSTGIGLANFLVKRLCSRTYLMSMQDPSHPLSSNARVLCSDRESRVTILASSSSFIPLVPCTKRLGFLSSSIASMASVSPSRLMSSTVCRFISFCRRGCDQTFNMETALSGSSLSRAATQGDVGYIAFLLVFLHQSGVEMKLNLIDHLLLYMRRAAWMVVQYSRRR